MSVCVINIYCHSMWHSPIFNNKWNKKVNSHKTYWHSPPHICLHMSNDTPWQVKLIFCSTPTAYKLTVSQACKCFMHIKIKALLLFSGLITKNICSIPYSHMLTWRFCHTGRMLRPKICDPHHEKTCLWHRWTTKAQIICALWSAPLLFAAWIV